MEQECNRAVGCRDGLGDSPKPWAYDLWKHLHDEHGLILLESELAEIVELARKL